MPKVSLVGSFLLALLSVAMIHAGATAQTVAPAERASKQMRAKQFDLALTSLTEALTDDTKNPMLYFRRAQCFYCLGRYKDAVEDFDHAIKLETAVPDFFLWRGTAEAKLGEDEAAVRDYERALRLKPELVIAYNDAHAKKPAEAAQSSSSDDKSAAPSKVANETAESGSNSKSKENPPAVSGESKSKENPPAESANTKSKEGPPAETAESKSKENRHAEPVTTTGTGDNSSKSSSAAPTKETASTIAKSVNNTIDLGYTAGAVKDYEEAIKRASVKSAAYFRAGTVYSGLCEIDFKGKLLGTLMDCSDDGTIGKRNEADYFSLKDANKDLREADDEISQNPSAARAYYARGRSYEQIGKDGLARADFSRAIDLDHNNATYFLARAFLLHKINEKDLAELDVRQALDIEPSLPRFIAFEPPKFVETDKEMPAK